MLFTSIYLLRHNFLQLPTCKDMALMNNVPTSQIGPLSFSFLLIMAQVSIERDRGVYWKHRLHPFFAYIVTLFRISGVHFHQLHSAHDLAVLYVNSIIADVELMNWEVLYEVLEVYSVSTHQLLSRSPCSPIPSRGNNNRQILIVVRIFL